MTLRRILPLILFTLFIAAAAPRVQAAASPNVLVILADDKY